MFSFSALDLLGNPEMTVRRLAEAYPAVFGHLIHDKALEMKCQIEGNAESFISTNRVILRGVIDLRRIERSIKMIFSINQKKILCYL